MNAGQPLHRLNGLFKAHFVAVLLGGVAVGALCPSWGHALKDLEFFRIPFTAWRYDFPNLALGLMMLSAIAGCDVRELRRVVHHPRPVVMSLAVIYGIIPALAAVAGLCWMDVSGSDDVQVLVGLMLSALMPVAMTSSVWVRLSSGNLPLLLALITVTTALSVLSVPLYLSALFGVSGASVGVPTGSIVQQLVVSVTLPMGLGLVIRSRWPALMERLAEGITLAGNVALWLVVVANVSVAAPHVSGNAQGFIAAVVLAVLLNAASYAVGLLCARAMRLSHEDSLTLIFGSGMRSNSTGLMLGLKGFPQMPLVSVPAAVYMISQHLIAAYLARRLERPGSKLLGTSIAVERRSLEAYLDRALPGTPSSGLGLVVVKMARPQGARLRETERDRLVRLVRDRVRQSDFVCLLGEDSFGLVLTNTRADGLKLVLNRVHQTVYSFEPTLKLTHGSVHTTDQRPSTDALLASVARATEKDVGTLPLTSGSGPHRVRMVS